MCPQRVVVNVVGASKQRGQVRVNPSLVVKLTGEATGSEGADGPGASALAREELAGSEGAGASGFASEELSGDLGRILEPKEALGGRIVEDDTSGSTIEEKSTRA